MKFLPVRVWPTTVLGVVLTGLGASSVAQEVLVPDHGAVFVTAVPHTKMVQSPAAVGSAPSASKGLPATFSGSPYTVGPVVTPTTTFPEAEEHVAVDPNVSSNLVAAISDFSRPLDVFFVNTTKFASSIDNGTSWIEGFVPQGSDGRPTTSDGLAWDANSDPVVARDRLGDVFMADLYINFISASFDGFYVNVGTQSSSGLTIRSTNPVAVDTPSGPFFEDKPWIAADNSGTTDNVYVCWTRFNIAFTTDFIVFSRSTDHGATWSTPAKISLDTQNGAVQGCQVAVGPSGAVYVAYEVFFVGMSRQHFLAKSTDGGVRFSAPKAITPVFKEVAFASFFRKNSFPALAVNPVNSNVVDVYAGNDLIGHSNVHFIQSASGKATFSAPVVINEVLHGEQFMPAVAIDDSGVIHASWFDTRNSKGSAAFAYDIFVTFSKDNGATFAPNARITPAQIVLGHFPTFIGDYSGNAAAGGFAHPVWTNGGFSTRSHLQTSRLTLP
jgi:hypothetical protein